jgi:broad specificity phosphatase PhoE
MPSQIQENTYHITLLRHGESVGNADGYHQGQSDFDLTEKGREQARALAQRWKKEEVTFDRVIASPLARARQTAEIITQILTLPLDLNPLWMELDIGVIAGLKHAEAKEKHPQPEFTHLYQPVGLTGESWWQLFLRAGQAVQDLLERPPGKYLIVSHGGILNMVLYAILGIIPQANFYGPHFRFENSAFATLTYEPAQHRWRVWGVNDRLHWPE